MNIGIDARMMGPGFGLGRYVEQLVLHLLQIEQAKDHVFVLFVKPDGKKQYKYLTKKYKNVQFVVVDIHWYSIKEQIVFPKIIRSQHIDLMHFPHWNVPLFYRGNFVLTIHDLIMYHFPRPEATTLGPILFFIKNKIHRLVLIVASRRAKHIFVTSTFTAEDVHNCLNIPFEKMTVTYQAPFKKDEKNKIKEIAIREKQYALYIGAAYPHKNISMLIDAWEVLEEKYGDDFELVLAGKENSFYTEIQKNIETSKSKNITYIGFVSDEELISLYKKALLYVFPSLYEGFGLPPLEAMQYGIPVASSNASCLPEVLSDNVLYFDPENKEHMADMIWKGLTDEYIRFDLINKSKQYVKQFSWNDLAQETFKKYFV
jgi:glycosyltransferase involved in cell wall biosynthesis